MYLKKNRMNHDVSLTELTRYLQSQTPGFVNTSPFPPSPPSNELVATLFKRQLALNSPAASFLQQRGLPSKEIQTLTQIPPVPVTAFKQLELTTVLPSERVTVFHSSGTTGQAPSRHYHSAATLQIYELAAQAWFKHRMLGDFPWAWQRRLPAEDERLLMVSLTPPPREVPHSSLAFMIGTFIREFGTTDSSFVGTSGVEGWQIDFAQAFKVLHSAQKAGPVVVFGTAFNFVHLADELERRGIYLQLPPGSRVMETGGYKGRSRTIPKKDLHDLIRARLGVTRGRIVCEYGMAELASQAYDIDLTNPLSESKQRRLQFPPWCHPSVVSPENGQEVPVGQPGLLRVTDLANVASVLSIQTEDLAVRHEDGIILLGRAVQSEPRGCSLLAVEN